MRGPLPSYRPEFPPTFLEQAAKIAQQRTVQYQLRQRATLVLLLHHQPFVSNLDAAEQVQLPLRSVQRWRRRWATGDFSLEDEPGRGRKAAFPPLGAPDFAEKAGPILALYAGKWQGKFLGPKDHVRSADEKTRIQARLRCHPSLPPAPGRPASIENEYERGGAWPYLAAWDVRRGYVMGRCEPTTGIVPFGRLVDQVLAEEPYRSGERLFWIVDNGSSHRGAAAKQRLDQVDSRIIWVHTPVHASWLKHVEIYFSIIQRKVLTPNNFADLEAIRLRLALSEALSNQSPAPFQWKFDRAKLATLLAKIEARRMALADAQYSGLEEAA